MASIEEILAQMRRSPKGVRFKDLCKVATSISEKPGSRDLVIASIGHLGRAIPG